MLCQSSNIGKECHRKDESVFGLVSVRNCAYNTELFFSMSKVDLREGSLAIVHKDEQMPMVRVLEISKIYLLTLSCFKVDGFLEGFVEAAAFHLWAGLV